MECYDKVTFVDLTNVCLQLLEIALPVSGCPFIIHLHMYTGSTGYSFNKNLQCIYTEDRLWYEVCVRVCVCVCVCETDTDRQTDTHEPERTTESTRHRDLW